MSHLSGLFLIVAIVLALVAPRLGNSWFTSVETRVARFAARKHTVVILIALTAILGRLALLWIFPVPVPAIHDESSYLLAADTFAHGRLTNPPHPMSFFLDTFHVQQHPTYTSIFPPAQGAALALGQVLGHPWIGVLLSMALMCAAMTWMLQGWFPPQWALLGGVLVLVRFALFSYWVNSYWGGALAGAGAAMVLGAFPRILHHKRSRDVLALAVGAGLLANTRPVEGLVFCIPVMGALVVWLFSRRAPAFRLTGPRLLLPFLLVMLSVLAFMGFYNLRVTGNALRFPHALYMKEQCNCTVFAWQKFPPPLHYANSQFDHFYNARIRGRYVPSWSGWKHRSWGALRAWWLTFLGSTLSIPFLTLPWLLRDRKMRLILAQFCLCATGLLLIVWFEPHYAAPLGATLLILLVQAFRHLRQWKCGGRPTGIALSRVIVLIVLANVPLYLAQTIRKPPPEDDWTAARTRIIQELAAMPDAHLVIVRYQADHVPDNEWVYNAADIDHSKVVWAREIPGHDLQPLLDYFRGRKVWLLEADADDPEVRPYSPAEN
jgi:hypothetical protein